ncbi:MAG: hypothetical protein R6X05_15610 [Desulfobacterales bacterium]|jgi:phage baseplate assembly protein W
MQKDPQLLTDIRLQVHHRDFRPVYRVPSERRPGPGGLGTRLDMALSRGRDNLAQAIIIRLLTPRGELAGLGHPDYGSRLHELVGRVNTETSRNLARLYILESLQQEPRIEAVAALTVGPTPQRRSSITVELQVKPVGRSTVLTVGPITLEFGS